MQSMIGIALSLFLIASLATAVHFSGWHGRSCRGPEIVNSQHLSPNECYTLIDGDFDNPLSSIRASGLQDTNAVGGDYIELYERSECRNWMSRVKWSGFCTGIVFRSVRYIPPSPRNDSAELEVQLTDEEIALAEEQRRADEELEATLLQMEEEFLRTGSMSRRK